ncbi:hypothetical protein DVH24_019638 [Malus domestica]|uniref:Uncharacterized protein n=1 Tax=Malus domestica TaxID=3750 RepID=A0A498I0X5_MALDO|nr:hypothetical protein DVH24_019638 [Malus domestica]
MYLAGLSFYSIKDWTLYMSQILKQPDFDCILMTILAIWTAINVKFWGFDCLSCVVAPSVGRLKVNMDIGPGTRIFALVELGLLSGTQMGGALPLLRESLRMFYPPSKLRCWLLEKGLVWWLNGVYTILFSKIISAVLDESCNVSQLGPINEDVKHKDLLSVDTKATAAHTRSQANSVTHRLTHFALHSGGDCTWLDKLPIIVCDLIEDEASFTCTLQPNHTNPNGKSDSATDVVVGSVIPFPYIPAQHLAYFSLTLATTMGFESE